MRKKPVAAILALFFGIFGTHRYYLGQKFLGILYTLAFFFTLFITIEEGAPIIMIPAVIAFLDFILLSASPKEIFDQKYNKHLYRAEPRSPEGQRPDYSRSNGRSNPHTGGTSVGLEHLKKRAIRYYREEQYEQAIQFFNYVLEVTPEDPVIHFNLACCYSQLAESDPAFYHLEKAVSCGFRDTDKIFEHQALAWLNHLDEMDTFVANGFRRRPEGAEPEREQALSLVAVEEQAGKRESSDLLSKIEELGALREKGILTDEEFETQKQRWLRAGE